MFIDIWNNGGRGAKKYELKGDYSGDKLKGTSTIPVVIYPGGATMEFKTFPEAMHSDHAKISATLERIELSHAIGYAVQSSAEGFQESLQASISADVSFSNGANYAAGSPSSVSGVTNKQTTSMHNGNVESAESNAATKSVAAPTEAYNRVKHYGKTPTQSDRKALGATSQDDVDHTLPLVQHYYEGDGVDGCKPGYQQTPQQRKQFAQDRTKMKVEPKEKNRSEGGKLSQYSKDKKKQYNLGTKKKT